jgi:hypothetical protein
MHKNGKRETGLLQLSVTLIAGGAAEDFRLRGQLRVGFKADDDFVATYKFRHA